MGAGATRPAYDHEIVHWRHDDSLHAKVFLAQEEVIRWIYTAMRAWFAYYLLLGGGTARERLQRAASSLERAADGLRQVGAMLEELKIVEAGDDDLLRTYRVAVMGWADAFDKISSGADLDQLSLAREGFSRLGDASAIAERVVNLKSPLDQHHSLSRYLSALGELRPSRRVPKKTIDKAKAPWRRALKAAGSPLNWKSLSS